jgi:hypothetical protein
MNAELMEKLAAHREEIVSLASQVSTLATREQLDGEYHTALANAVHDLMKWQGRVAALLEFPLIGGQIPVGTEVHFHTTDGATYAPQQWNGAMWIMIPGAEQEAVPSVDAIRAALSGDLQPITYEKMDAALKRAYAVDRPRRRHGDGS